MQTKVLNAKLPAQGQQNFSTIKFALSKFYCRGEISPRKTQCFGQFCPRGPAPSKSKIFIFIVVSLSLFLYTKFFENPSGHGRLRQKSWTSAPKHAAPLMGRNFLLFFGNFVPQYKWEAYCRTNGRCTVGFPFLQGLEARKVE